MITAIEIENFKAIGERIRVELIEPCCSHGGSEQR
jgi:hypothetical protein